MSYSLLSECGINWIYYLYLEYICDPICSILIKYICILQTAISVATKVVDPWKGGENVATRQLATVGCWLRRTINSICLHSNVHHLTTFIRNIHTYIHTYIYTYIHTYIDACIHAYTHTYIMLCIPSEFHIHSSMNISKLV